MSFPVHHLCQDLHSRINLFEADVKYWLQRLGELHQSGFSPETTPMRQLAHDAGMLRHLADMIDAMRSELTKQPELTST